MQSIPVELISISTLALVTAGLTQMLKGLLTGPRRPWLPVIVTACDVVLGLLIGWAMAPSPDQIGLSLLSWGLAGLLSGLGAIGLYKVGNAVAPERINSEAGFRKIPVQARPYRHRRKR